ncbi:alpha/beta hydrolase [Sphingomonas sp.]|uniref:alpha/beta hydrolase n=1 Tax=Sphingomonas sp. TaxID=28214 RepID=UPI001B02BB1B|nr:alpha/beta hydrolase [Sphingomonas sp.]MBO9713543.1 alpha/beta hydrolase [Sphingomonas sp.]
MRPALLLLPLLLAMPVAGALLEPLTAATVQPGVAHEYAYGADPLQQLDFYPAKGRAGPAPLIVFIHGGGWKRGDKDNATGASKIEHFTGKGYAFVSVDYRLVPGARVEDQAADVASALAWVVGQARQLGIDPARIVLMGHSAGAHLAALVSTDPQWLRAAGLGFDAIRGTVLLDGAAYDVPAQLSDGPRVMQGTYRQAFGGDPARQKALSPYWQAAAPNVGAFLVLHVDREDGTRQSEALAAALRKAGSRVELDALEGRGLMGHMAINRQLGETSYPGTAIVDRWVDALLR